MVFRSLVLAMAVCTSSGVAMAKQSSEGDIRAYAALMDMDVSQCKLSGLNARMQQSLAAGSPDAIKARREFSDCRSSASTKAKENLPKALNSTESKDVKDAVKNLYVAWDAYMGDLENKKSNTLKENYETAQSKLEVELLSE